MRDKKSARVVELCKQQKIFVAVAESLTVGRIQSLIGRASGASNVFAGGLTAYNIEQKVNLLGVDRAHAEEVDCVSGRVAAQMATGVTELFRADIGIATTGYAEPPEPAKSHESYAYFAIYDKHATSNRNGIVVYDRLSATGLDRTQAQKHFARLAFDRLLDYLEHRSGTGTVNLT